MRGHGRRAVDRPRHARLVPRRLGRDDGRDDVPVGRADGRAVLAHDAASGRRSRRCSSPPATSLDVGGRRAASPSRSRVAGGACRRRRARVGPRRAAGSPAATLARRRRLRADAAQGRLPRQVPQPARLPARRRGATAASGALQMGATHGAWCVGCCWALMASLFALGVMSIAWMAFVAGADRGREDAAVAARARRTGRRRSCSCSACSCSPRRTRSRG